jgi:RHS repeat-associated protein
MTTDPRTSRCGGRQGLRWVGDPVDVVTGALADAAAEFTLPLGPRPGSGALVWRRYYNTASLSEGPLGRGHTHEYDHTLRAVVDGWLYTQPDGETVLFPFAPPGESREHARFVLKPTKRGFTLRAPDGTELEFEVSDVSATARPRKVSRETWSIALEHDPRGRLVRLADSAGAHVVTLDYAGEQVQTIWLARHPVRTQGPPLALMRYQYSEAGDLLAAIDRYGHAQRFTYDAAHRMLTRVDRDGYRFEYAYDAAGRCVLSRGHDRNGEVRLQYMPEAQATEVTRADGGAWLYRYDASLSITEIIDPYGGIRRFEYDESGRLIAEADAGGHTRRPVYDAAGEVVAWRTAAGGLRPAESSSGPLPHREPQTPVELELGDLAAEVVAGAPLASPGIEPLLTGGASIYSPLFPERDPRASVRRDELGLLVEERGSAASPRRWAYTPNGWVRWYSDHDGGRYEFEFAGGNLRNVARDPLGRTIRYEYTLTDQIAAVTDPAGNRHTYHHDLRDALTEVYHYEQLVESYKYDRTGDLIAKHDARGELLVSYRYGPDGLKSVRRLADGEEHRYTYTPSGQFARIEWSGHALEFEYTALGRRRKDLRDGRGVEHSFLAEQLTATTVLGRFTTRYRRLDAQTLEITDPLGNVHRLVLESDGVVTRHLACGARELAQVDSRGHVLEKHLFPANPGEEVWRRTFAYSAEGDLLAVKDSERGETRYQYDAAHQLAAAISPEGQVQKYTYDEAANLVEAPHLPAAAIGPGNQLLMANGSSLTYDHRNNLSVWERDDRTLRFRRDALDQLREIEGLDAPWTADYDPLGRRTRKAFGAAWTEYLWDTDRLAAEIHSSGRVRVYVYVDDFSLTPWLTIDYDSVDAEPTSGTLHYLVTDQRGAPIAALDAAGERVWSADLAPYGLAVVQGELDVSHRLAGQLHDPETGLCYNRFRYYSPELGRYLEEDPAGTGGGLNLYAYTCCPLTQFDPRGLAVCRTCGGKHKTEDHPRTKDPKPTENGGKADNRTFKSRQEALDAIYDRLNLPRGAEPDIVWEVGNDYLRRGQEGYLYSTNPTSHGKYMQFETSQGSRVIAEHTSDPDAPHPHFHAGQPKVEPGRTGVDFGWTGDEGAFEKYKPVDGAHHFYYEDK